MYFVTFSEMLGTHGEQIARSVSTMMSYRFLGEDELYKAAQEEGYLADVMELDEKGPAFVERLFSEKPKIHLDRLQSVIYDVAQKGNAVFFGRGSQAMLRSFDCALHVLVVGSMDKRIRTLMEENKIGREVAEKIIRRSAQEKRGFLRFAYDEDWLDPHLYDLMVNTDKLSVDAAAKMVFHAAKSDAIKACGIDSVKELGKLALHRKVESALMEAGVMSAHIFVNVDDPESVRLYGITSSPDEKQLVEKTVKRIKDAKRVINDVAVFSRALNGV
jgi:cytidylate kinase